MGEAPLPEAARRKARPRSGVTGRGSPAETLARRRACRQPSVGSSSRGRRSVEGVPRAAGTQRDRDCTTGTSPGKEERKGQAEGLSPAWEGAVGPHRRAQHSRAPPSPGLGMGREILRLPDTR